MTIRQLIQHKQYQEAIAQSKDEPIEEFFIAIYPRIRNHRLKEEQFWQALFSKEANHLLASEFIYPVLREFWKHLKPSDQLIAQFAKTHPKAFIQSIRFQRLFLKEGFLNCHMALMSSSSYLQMHFDMMSGLLRVKQDLEKQISSHDEWLKATRMEVFLTELIIWWEENQKEDRSSRNTHFSIAQDSIRRFFKVHRPLEPTDVLITYQAYRQTVESFEAGKPRRILRFLHDLNRLSVHENDTISLYCDELRNDFDDKGNYVKDKVLARKFYEDGQKLIAFETYYRLFSERMTDELIDLGDIKLKESNDLDYYSYQGRVMGRLLLDYIQQFEIMTDLDEFMPGVLSSLTIHTQSRYRLVLNKLLQEMSLKKALLKLSEINDLNGFPIQIHRFQDFIQKTKWTTKSTINDVQSNQVINRELSKPLNIDLQARPIIELPNNQLLHLMPIACEANIFFRVYFNVVKDQNDSLREKADQSFEKAMATVFPEDLEKTHSFKFPIDSKSKDGDIDTAIKDGKEVLIIEAKRTALRINSQDIWKEKEERFLKGALQLYKAEKGLKEGTIKGLFKTEIEPDTTITSWIVSPWFEYDHEKIGQFRKVSWFEIRFTLENLKPKWENASNRLRAIINLIEQDQVWPEIFKIRDRYDDMMKRVVDIYQHIDFDAQ